MRGAVVSETQTDFVEVLLVFLVRSRTVSATFAGARLKGALKVNWEEFSWGL